MVVSPKACSMVTGKASLDTYELEASELEEEFSVPWEQAARETVKVAARRPARTRDLRMEVFSFSKIS